MPFDEGTEYRSSAWRLLRFPYLLFDLEMQSIYK